MDKISNWLLNNDLDSFPILGYESFNSFIKVCESVSKWAVDDSGLANRADSYKIWICIVKDVDKLKNILEKYKSLNLLNHYLNKEIVENSKISLYIKLDYLSNKWMLSYGITNDKKLYKIGEFEYNISIKLPTSEILKYVKDDIEDFDPRKNYLLRLIKKDFYSFDPGTCQRLDPVIISGECVLSCNNLGIWDNNTMSETEANKWLEIFKSWVGGQKWWDMVKLKVKARRDKWIDFSVQTK